MINPIILCGAIIHLAQLTTALEIVSCNCARPENKGILDLEPPDSCRSSGAAALPLEADYKIYTIDKPHFKFQGFTCTTWQERKTVVGYPFASYDSTYETITKEVTTDECKRMARLHECGGPNIKMTVDEGNYVYNMKPNCQGKYWSTVSFATINIIHKIHEYL